MQTEEYARMHALEDHYWWFVGRRRLALRLLRKYLRSGKPRILDLGCGTGIISRELAAIGDVVSLDFSDLALGFCQGRGLGSLVQAKGEAVPLVGESVDAVVALDILEHIEDDKAAFAECFRVLKSGGIMVLSVPAFRSLWGPHDVALMHHRRYRLGLVRQRLSEAGFKIERLSYSVFFLFPLVVLIRAFEKRRKGEAKASLPAVPELLNKALIGLQSLEARLICGMRLPWGSSVVAVARKP